MDLPTPSTKRLVISATNSQTCRRCLANCVNCVIKMTIKQDDLIKMKIKRLNQLLFSPLLISLIKKNN